MDLLNSPWCQNEAVAVATRWEVSDKPEVSNFLYFEFGDKSWLCVSLVDVNVAIC